MLTRRILLAAMTLLITISSATAGDIFEVKSRDGDKEITYQVQFGGGFLFDQYTAFDPATKKFVYLTWKREGKPPEPVMSIWDHRTGDTIPLYKFPDVKNPLPIIPSMEAMKVCPMTGDKKLTSKLIIIVD